MPQPATQHPPLCRPELPWPEHVLIRLDEIIGLLDGIDTSLAVLSLAVTQPASAHTPDANGAAHLKAPSPSAPSPVPRPRPALPPSPATVSGGSSTAASISRISGTGKWNCRRTAAGGPFSTAPQDVAVKLSMHPRALVLDGLLYDGPDEIIAALGSFTGLCIVLLPVGVDHTAVADIKRLPCVMKVVQGETDFAALTGTVYEQGQAQQSSVGSGMGDMPTLSARPVATSGWRSIAVWNLQEGVGKSTLSAALALEAASRRLPTLLVGLGAPDPLPLSLGLRPEPNLQSWRSRPTLDGLKAAVQSYDALDLLAGFPAPLELTAYLPDALEGDTSLSRLAGTAAYAGYAVVVLDVSSPGLPWRRPMRWCWWGWRRFRASSPRWRQCAWPRRR